MLKKTVTYRDFDNNERTEDLYFNMTQMQLTEFAADLPDDVFDVASEANGKNVDKIQMATRISEKLGAKGVIGFIKKLVLDSYGVKSEDGRRFIKNDKLREEFEQTLVFDKFMSDLMSDDEAAANFVNSIIPPDLAAKVAAKQAEIAGPTEG